MKITRYSWWEFPEDIVQEPTGEYVLYEDHLKAMEALRARLGAPLLTPFPDAGPDLLDTSKEAGK